MPQQVIEGFRPSPQQQRLWRLQDGRSVGTAQCVLALTGDVRAAALREALPAVVARHEILRTRFERLPGMEMPIQVISDEPLLEIHETALDGGFESLEALLEQERVRPGLGHGRFTLASTPGGPLLVITLPALLADSQSLDNLAAEIARAYDAAVRGGEDWEEPPLQYVQFSEWQNEVLEEPGAREALDFWERQRLGEEGLRELPLEPPSASEIQRVSPVRTAFAPSAGAAGRIEKIAREHGASLEAFLLACWGGLMARLSGAADIGVDVFFDGRKVAELEDVPGPFGRFLPLALRGLAERSLARILRRVEAALAEAGQRQELCPVRIGREPGLLGFAFEKEAGPWTGGGVTFAIADKLYASGDCRLILCARRRGDDLALELQADPAASTGDSLRLLAGRFLALLESAARAPETLLEELEWIGPEESRRLEAWSLVPSPAVEEPVTVRSFAAQAARTPDAPAVSAAGETLTFRELQLRSGELSRWLRRMGVGPESRVALYLDRSVEAIVALLAVLEAGGAYVPIDTGQTEQRLAWILDDSGADVVVTRSSLAGALPPGSARLLLVDEAGPPGGDVAAASAGPRSCAYVIYTSGSTGHPKGTLIENRSVACLSTALAAAVYADFEDGSPLRVAVNAPLSFDASVKQVIQLLRGHSLWLVPEEARGDGEALLGWLREHRIDVLDCTPSHLRLLLDAGLAGEGSLFPRVLLVGGEAIRPDLWREIAADRPRRYYNVYGPTECTVDAVACRVDSASGPTLGRSLPGVGVHVLDGRLQRIPVGVPGELCLTGAQLSRGYLGRPDLTAEKFAPFPFAGEPGARLYRTGDRVRFLPDGRLEFLGRLDRQIKIRGIRVEPGEIEAALRESPLVRDALVVLREDQPGNQRLVAYAVPRRRAAVAATSAGRPRYELPNGMAVVHQNRNETDYLYEEIFEKRCYLRHGVRLPADACVVDVGANIGMFTLLVHQECASPRVYAFEPIPAIFEALRSNCELYGPGTRLFPFGLSDGEREESFTFYPRYTMMSGQSRHARPESEAEVVKRYLENLREEGDGGAASLLEDADELLAGRFQGEKVTAHLRRLSDVLREERIAHVDLLKIDVQRAEVDVLHGLDEEDWERIDQVVLEVHDAPGTESEGRVGEVLALLESKGFRAVAEQDELLIGTDRYNVYAVSRRLDGADAEPRRPLPARGAAPDAADLRQFLKVRLPEALVPAAVVWLDEIPLTRNGKVDFPALPLPEERAPERQAAPPRTPHEEVLAGLWAEVLGVERVGVDESFFELGGHSLLATQLMSRTRAVFGVELPLRALFERPTVEELAARIEEVQRAGQGVETPPLVPVPRGLAGEQPPRLSFAQQRLWFLHQLDPQSPTYNTPQAFAVSGELDVPAFARALSEVVRRHEVLRTVFLPVAGEPRQVVRPAAPVPVPLIDLAGLSGEPRPAEERRLMREDAWAPFDLEHGPLLRCILLRLGAREHVVLLAMHHVVSDAWSIGILIRELSALYEAFRRGGTSPLAELPVQYGDFSEWQRSWLQGEALEAQLRFWASRLEGADSRASLPLDRPRTARVGRREDQRRFLFEGDAAEALQRVAQAHRATLFMLLLAGLQTLLWRYGEGGDLVAVGTPIAGRNRIEIEPLIGFFVNTLVLTSRLGDDPGFSGLLERTREETLSAFAHQDLPFEKLVEEVAPRRDVTRAPLFDVLFALQNVEPPSVELPDLRIARLREEGGAAKFDLSLILSEGDRWIGGGFSYDPSLFDAATVERLSANLAALLRAVSAEPGRRLSDLPLLAEPERHALLSEWNGLAVPATSSACLHELFEAQVAKAPEAVAVTGPDAALTYAGLDRRAEALGRHLRSLGIGPESRVGVLLERTPELVVALLAVLKAGGAYVPLDPAYPQGRLAFMLRDSGASVLLTRRALLEPPEWVPEGCRHVFLEEGWESASEAASPAARPGNLAYVIYTSGSTGTPKGVLVTHANVVRLLSGTRPWFGFGPEDVWTLFHASAFDFSVWEIWGALLHGGRLVVVPWTVSRTPESFHDLLVRERVTVLNQTPAAFAELQRVDESPARSGSLTGLRVVIFGGEALVPSRLAGWLDRHGEERPRLVNMYGITETTVHVTYRPISTAEARRHGSVIGVPIPGLTVHVLDAGGRPAAIGAPGELAIGGAGLARGYLGRPDLTAERFVPDPFHGRTEPGARLYRSGDLGRFLPGGELEFLGRIDHQVKIRGFRIEPGEIEAVLLTHPGVRQAVVVAREDAQRDRRLVAYVTFSGEPVPARELRQLLRGGLPEHMVPSAFVALASLPHTASGKIDRRALPAPELASGSEDRSGVPPRNLPELELVRIWEELLGVHPVGVHDDFFELGGHSLLATRLLSRVRERLRTELPLRALFESPTVAGLAERVEKVVREDGAAGGAPPLVPVPRDRPLRLSFAQQRLWFLHQLDPESPAYNMPQAFAVAGALDVAAFTRALSEIVRRHEVLRSVLAPFDGEPRQVVRPAAALPVPAVDLGDLPEAPREAEVRRLTREDARAPFDLEHGPLLRCALLRRSSEDHVVLLAMHHVAGDAWSTGILVRELSILYEAFRRGEGSPLAELPLQYGDFAEWQRSWLQGEVLEAQLRFWASRLEGTESRASLPLDRPRTGGVGRLGERRPVLLERETSEALEETARARGVTLFMLLLAAMQTLLWRHGGGEDTVVLGTPVAGRNRLETEPLIGFFVNTLVLASRLADDPPFSSWLERTREETLSAFAHQDVPFEKLVEEIAPQRDATRTPLFDVLFALQNVETPSAEPPDLRIAPLHEMGGAAKFELSLVLGAGSRGIAGEFSYDPALFDAATVERLSSRLKTLLAAIAAEPERRLSELPLLPSSELEQVLHGWNATRSAYPGEACLPELFEQVARELGDAPAVVAPGGEAWSYRRLDEESNRLARRLRSLGAGPGAAVGISMERSPELILGLLAIMKAGAAYVPLDAGYPEERLAFMLEGTGAQAVLVHAETQERWAGRPGVVRVEEEEGRAGDGGSLSPQVPSDSLAYIVYTSGSTGRPKGVAVPHRAVVRLVRETDYVRLGRGDRVAHLSNTSFDAATFEIWGALLNGAAVVVVPREVVLAPADFASLLRRERVTALFLTTALFNQVVCEAPGAFSGVRHLLFGGEAVDPGAVARALEQEGPERLLHVYGPTESTTFATWHLLREVPPGATTLPIGLPLANTTLYVLDSRRSPVPPGVAGELFLGGDGLARGYWNRPELTAERFVPHPWGAGDRLYRTGDRVRQRPDGSVEFLGRLDRQVKIRGFRVEPGEVEAALLAHPDVREAAVLALREEETRLVAYVAPRLESDLRAWLAERLPGYMIPSAWVFLDALPLTPNGKIDRRALPAPGEAETESEPAVPRDPVEELLEEIWAEVLGRGRVGVHDDFFELGGHSLLATRLMSRVRERFRTELPLRVLFESPTVAGLAERVKQALQEGVGAGSAPPLVRVPRDHPPRLSFAQQRLWFLYQLDSESPAYNMPQAFAVSGALDAAAFTRALSEIVRRHEVLRTVFLPFEGEPRQVVRPAAAVPVPLVDLGGLAEKSWEAEVRRLAQEDARAPFNLERGPLLRCALLRRSAEEHAVLLAMHHVASDAWSMGILVRELSTLYGAFRHEAGSPLAELPLQYGDFAEWQRSWLQGEVLEAQLRFWASRLEGAESRASLPLDRPRTSRVGRRGEQRPFLLEPGISEALEEAARAHGVTLFMLLLAAVQTLLWRSGGGEDTAVLGTPIAGRNRLETEPLIGFFVNTLVLASRLGDDPAFSALLERTREETLSAFAHQDVPFEKLVEEIAPQRDATRTPLFDVLFALQNVDAPAAELPGLRIEPLREAGGAAKFELSLALSAGDRGIGGGIGYDPSLFDAATVERLAAHLAELLRGAVAEPGRRLSELPLLAAPERHALLWEENDTRTPFGPAGLCVHALVEAQVARAPERVAVVSAGEVLTYAELSRRAGRLARRLRRLGVGPDVPVGVCLERSAELVVALLAVLKAGGAYVPLDPEYPRDRLAFMVEDSGLPVLVTRSGLAADLPAGSLRRVDLDAPEPEVSPSLGPDPAGGATADHLMYVIYTSGSTGRPKGVQVSHRGVVDLFLWTLEQYSMTAEDRILHKSAFNFDFSAWECFAPLLIGACVVVAPPGAQRDSAALVRLMREEGITLVQFVPSMLEAFLEDEGVESCAGLRSVFVGGEALTPELVRRYRGRLGAALRNQYGPTETTIYVTEWPDQDRREEAVSLGRPHANVGIHLVDPRGWLCPPGVPGELLVEGVRLARGYLGRPELTAERFVPNPFGEPGSRLYRTGDLARRLPGGRLEFLGRLDHQVKVRGFRIELGDIEAALRSHPGVREAVAAVREDAPGDRRLVAYVVPGGEAAPPAWREWLSERLPEHMVPAAFVTLESLPLSPSGKLDRRALPAPEWSSGSLRASLPPRNLFELELVRIWEDLLGIRPVGIADDFFDLGGHSLLATRLMSRVRERFGTELPLRALFESPTVAGLAQLVERAEREGEGAGAAPPLVPVPRDRPPRLSFAQQRLWYLHQLDPESPAYNMPQAFAVAGELDVPAFVRALSGIVRRHEVLRTVLVPFDGEPRQVVRPAAPVPVPRIDLEGLPEAAREAEVRRLAREDARTPFDLERGPLLRCAVLRRDARRHAVLLMIHHAVSDGWSTGILIRELSALYGAFRRGGESPLAELPLQYGDFAEWQRSWLAGDVLEGQLRFWSSRLEGSESRASLPLDRPRSPQVGHAEEQRLFVLPPEVAEALVGVARAHGVTLFMLLLAAVQTLLWRHGGGEDLVTVGTPTAGRNRLEIEPLIGFFVNTLVLPARLGDDPGFSGLLERTREEALSVFAHQEVPFEKLVEEIAPQRDATRTPLFDVLFALQNVDTPSAELPDLRLEPLHEESGAAKFDLSLVLSERGRRIGGTLGYDPALFDAATVERLSAHLAELLRGAVSEPGRRLSELPLLAAAERHMLLSEENDTRAPFGLAGSCVPALVEAQVARTPDRVAVVSGREILTYAELSRRADRLAHRLRGLGVGPDVPVGVCLERSAELVVALLAVLKAGGAYVPLDPEYPRDRLAFMVEDSGIPVLVTRSALAADLPAGALRRVDLDAPEPEAPLSVERNPAAGLLPDHLMYVIYTSGSTGRPKGVQVSHRSVLNLFQWTLAAYGLTEEDRILHKAAFNFDFSAWECFAPLLVGARVVVAPPGAQRDSAALMRLLREEEITLVQFVPSMLDAFLEDEGVETCAGLRSVFVGGEALTPALVSRYRRRLGAVLRNQYGPTETTIYVTEWPDFDRRQEGTPVPLGRPHANVGIHLVDPRGHLCPLGVPGELRVEGPMVARGYLGRPELTAERFVPNPFGEPGSRLYRTGDLARRLPDGRLEFLGRIDDQVKVRGFRIELGEIEAVLRSHPGVREAVVIVREDVPGDRRLVAYVVPDGEAAPQAWREWASERLPELMVPAAFVALEALPLSPAGKLDRRALPAPEWGSGSEARSSLPPRNLPELELIPIFEDLLGVRPVGVTDDFFALGGHSLLATRLMSRVEARFGPKVSLAQFLQTPTIEGLARAIRSGEALVEPMLVPLAAGGSGRPLFLIHPIGGGVLCYAHLARHLGSERPLYGLQRLKTAGAPSRVEDLAARYLASVRGAQPSGPYLLAGWSMGGLIAYEMACQLAREGETVEMLALIDPSSPKSGSRDGDPTRAELLTDFAVDLGLSGPELARLADAGLSKPGDEKIWPQLLAETKQLGLVSPDLDTERLQARFEIFTANVEAQRAYVPRPYRGPLTLLLAAAGRGDARAREWKALARRVEVQKLAGGHYDLVREPLVKALAEHLRAAIRRARSGKDS